MTTILTPPLEVTLLEEVLDDDVICESGRCEGNPAAWRVTFEEPCFCHQKTFLICESCSGGIRSPLGRYITWYHELCKGEVGNPVSIRRLRD